MSTQPSEFSMFPIEWHSSWKGPTDYRGPRTDFLAGWTEDRVCTRALAQNRYRRQVPVGLFLPAKEATFFCATGWMVYQGWYVTEREQLRQFRQWVSNCTGQSVEQLNDLGLQGREILRALSRRWVTFQNLGESHGN